MTKNKKMFAICIIMLMTGICFLMGMLMGILAKDKAEPDRSNEYYYAQSKNAHSVQKKHFTEKIEETNYSSAPTSSMTVYNLVKEVTPTVETVKTTETEEAPEETRVINPPMEKHITKTGGVFWGPSGYETYYNLKMDRVVSIMRDMGYSEEEYPYWIREDGAKMFGDYVMVAANLELRPKGTIVECSLGTAIVVDTGSFAKTNKEQLDIAVNW